MGLRSCPCIAGIGVAVVSVGLCRGWAWGSFGGMGLVLGCYDIVVIRQRNHCHRRIAFLLLML